MSFFLGVAPRMLCLHQLPDSFSWTKICLASRQALLRQLLRGTFCQEMHILQQAYHRSWGHKIHFFRRQALAFTMLCLCNVSTFNGRKRVYHRWRGHYLSGLCQRQAHGHFFSRQLIMIEAIQTNPIKSLKMKYTLSLLSNKRRNFLTFHA